MSGSNLSMEVMDLLARLRAEDARPSREKELLAVAINAMLFITSTGQRYAFEDYLGYLESNDPPPVVAAFMTREEAEAWLNSHPQPPDSACVLIGDEYHLVVYNRRINYRHLMPHATMGYHLGDLAQGGLPSPVASFETREEAKSWLDSQPAPPTQAVIHISGEPYLAVHHRNIHHRALYPFSMAIAADEEPGENEAEEPPQQP